MVVPTESKGPLLPHFYAGRSILITGGTGFLGKVLIERLLYTCPDVHEVLLLMRDKRGQASLNRLEQLKQSQAFDNVRARCPQQLDKLRIVSGDVAKPRLGLDGDALNQLQESLVNVTQTQNVVASEQLVRFALCKLATVATGDAKRELMLILGYKYDEALSMCYKKVKPYMNIMKQSDLTVTNRMYVNYTKAIDPKFIQDSTENDGVRVDKVGFNYPIAAVAHINNLISAMTFRRITDIVDINDIDKSTKMIIISGAHYKGTWETPFDYRLTKLGKFKHIDGKTSKVPMMTRVGDFMYKDAIDCEVLTLKFRSFQASMTFILPKSPQGLMPKLAEIYNEKGIVSSLTRGLQEKTLKVSIPRFKIKTYVDWTGFLQGLGLYSIFNTNSSDLSGILTAGQNQTIYLNKIKQKVFVQIDEMGVSRQVPDILDKNKREPEMPAYRLPSFIADRPFYFEIALELDDGRHEMFTGVYFGPEPDLPTF